MQMSSLQVITRMVALGFGLSVVPELAVDRDDVVAIPLAGLGPARKIGVVLADPGPPSRAARAFVDLLRAELA
jgi:DNA-binding transcriptional LysR family regulator